MNDINSILKSYKNAVFFGGAGVSTESGIPDFRSQDGLYNQKYSFPPETIISHSFFMQNPKEFYRFYFDKMIYQCAKPNFAHKTLAELEKSGYLSAVITQNIDGLHQEAGSNKVLELHGSVHRNYCLKCGKFFDLEGIINSKDSEGIPRCSCGGIIKPDVVLYEEGLDDSVVQESLKLIREAELVIIGGTSLTVYPAASFVSYSRGDIMLINKTKTREDVRAKYVFNQPIGELLKTVKI